jgi:hypothetical protein
MGCKLVENVFKIFLWIYVGKEKLLKDIKLKRHFSMPFHLGMG